jgi:hypothetical protein
MNMKTNTKILATDASPSNLIYRILTFPQLQDIYNFIRKKKDIYNFKIKS